MSGGATVRGVETGGVGGWSTPCLADRCSALFGCFPDFADGAAELGRFGEFPASRQLALLPASKRDGDRGVAEPIFLRSPPVRLVCGDGGGVVAIRVHGEKASPEASDRGVAVS